MRTVLTLALLAAAAESVSAGEGWRDPDEESWSAEPVAVHIPGPWILDLSARALVTRWDDKLDMGTGSGFGFNVIPAILGPLPEGREGGFNAASFLPLNVRFWRARERNGSGAIKVISYGLLGMWGEYVAPGNSLGVGFSALWGPTRFSGDKDRDKGHGFALEGQAVLPISASFRGGAGATFDLVSTDFNQDRKNVTMSLSATLSLEVSF